MSIAQKITSIEGHISDDYQGLINLGADLTGINKNILNIKTVLDNIYNDMPKVTGEGTEVTLTPTKKGKLGIVEKGNSTQEGTPTPSNPIPIKNVTGNNNVVVKNSDNSASQTLPLNLGSIELNGINDTYRDLIFQNVPNSPYYDNTLIEGAWYKKEVIAEKVFTGSENWQQTTYNNLFFITNYNSGLAYIIGGYCDYFTFINNSSITDNNTANSQMANNQMAFRLGNTKDRTYLKSTNFSTTDELKTWLSSHNTTLKYVKTESTDIQITDTTLISQLEAIDKAQSYNGTTIITSTYDSSNAQMILGASGLKGE